MKREDLIADFDLAALSDDAKGVAGAWFGMIVPSRGDLTFQLRSNKPSPRAQSALNELVRLGYVSVEPFNRFGGLVYKPLVRMDAAFDWLGRNRDNESIKFSLVEPVADEKDARTHQRAALRAQGEKG